MSLLKLGAYTLEMGNEEFLNAEIQRLKQQSIHDKAKAQRELGIAEWKAEALKSKSKSTLAIVSVLLFCSVVIAISLI